MHLDWRSKPFTYNFSQPAEYRFSLDSIELPWRVAQFLKNEKIDLNELTVLDLCAGCGVIGFELQYWCPEISRIDFVEVQPQYVPHFEKNKALVLENQATAKDYRFLNISFNDMLTEEYFGRYDLIVCNPPYFREGMGVSSSSRFKNRCRFLAQEEFVSLAKVLCHTLKEGGFAFVLLRDLSQHGVDQTNEMKGLCESVCMSTVLEPIRGTPLVLLEKCGVVR